MIYLKDYSKLEECISEEINKESSLLQSIYKETGDSEERVDRFAKLMEFHKVIFLYLVKTTVRLENLLRL